MIKDDRRTGAGPRTMDGSTAMGYWGDMLRSMAFFWENQIGRWSKAMELMRQGGYDSSRWLKDFTMSWDEWAALVASPCQWGGMERLVPTFLLVVDGEAEFVGPADAPTPVFLPPGVTTAATDLYQVGSIGPGSGGPTGTHRINASRHVRVQLSPALNRVEISLVDLGRGQGERKSRNIFPGLHVGAAYATEVATRHPLAIIYALVEESTVP